MQLKTLNRIFAITVIAGVLVSSSMPYNTLAQSPLEVKSIDNAEQVLMKLTDAQRQALEELDARPGFVIAPNIDTHSPELVNVIVEFNQAPAKVEVMKQAVKGLRMTTKEASVKIEKAHSEFKHSFEVLKNQKSGSPQLKESKITREYRTALTGVAMTIPGTAVEDLLSSGVVKRVWKDEMVQLDLPAEPKIASESQMMDSLPQIGVDKLHAEKVTGKGIKVGVIDTGIDYNHPDLKYAYQGYRASFGSDPKAIDPNTVKGWDFVDNDADPMETTYKNWQDSKQPEINPSSGSAYYTEHGTHVSGTIAGEQKNNVDYAVEGVAPDVDLYSYRVLGPYGSGATAGVIAGIDKAISDGMDVINLSLGNSLNDPLYPTSVAINNAMLSGVVSVVAAGNAGPNELTLGAPATSALGITVGASDFAMNIPTFTSMSAGEQTVKNVKLLGKNYKDKLETLQNQSMQVMFAGLGKATDFEGKDFTGKIALIERGELAFIDKIKNAAKAGAKAVIIYNNIEGEIPSYLGEAMELIPSFSLTQADGKRLKELGDNTSLTFGALANTQTEGDSLASFSSRGPVAGSYDIKPDVVAPGVAIFSTIPEYINSPEDGVDYTTAYTRLQGTSMATPHVTGVAALVLQKHPEYTPFDVKAALMNTAVDLKGDNSVFEQGAGRIDAYDAVHTDISIKVMDTTQTIENGQVINVNDETGSISFGSHYQLENGSIEDSRKVVIKNHGEEDKTFNIEVEYHGERTGIKDAVANGIKLDVPSSVTVAGGKSSEMQPKITVPQSAAAGRYEGYIHVTNTNNPSETYQVPFTIRVAEKGIESLELSRSAAANDVRVHPFYTPIIGAKLQLKSPMQSIDIVLKDEKTDKAIGYLGTLNASTMKADVTYTITSMYTGYINPFTNDPQNPISSEKILVPEGNYKFELIGHDEQGKSYSLSQVFIVDNTAPEVTFKDYQPGVIEVDDSMYTDEDSYHALWVHGKVYDSTIDVLKGKGVNGVDQSKNQLAYYPQTSAFPGFIPVKANGDIKFGVLPEEIATKPYQLRLLATDYATAANFPGGVLYYYFVKQGTEYATNDYNKEEVRKGGTITTTLTVNNVKQLVSGEFGMRYEKAFFQYMNVKASKQFKEYAKKNHLSINLKDPVITGDSRWNTVKVGASIEGSNFAGMDGDMPFLDVTFKAISDSFYDVAYAISLPTKNFTYLKAGQEQSISIPYFAYNMFNLISTHSVISGKIKPEGFLNATGSLNNKIDYSKIGAKVYAKAANGKVYKGTISASGSYKIEGVLASSEAYTLYLEIPGHLTGVLKGQFGKQKGGEWLGQSYSDINFPLTYAGDVNKDRVIDIRDVQSVANTYGTNTPVKEDINQDNSVNETDIRFVEKNFLRIGLDAQNNKQPKETLNKKGVTDFLHELGLEPKN
ncbi:S8 family serine peptidase [Bacillus sp. AFS017336]|uniref:S8 family serine peptidase n=1 Tax=Bacillus sp. AFS017336 TaxID=2033489 RepID=UPI000BF006C5|nr:S8 family serine peptidase [Bacillus sp. AFS017336]PEL06035.1 peptidase S8 [Bacillus sp. AFS017336]